jgi:hypothetical protein
LLLSHKQDDKQIAPIKPGDTVLLASAPEPSPPPPSGRGGAADDDDLDADDLPRIDRSRLTPTQLRAGLHELNDLNPVGP